MLRLILILTAIPFLAGCDGFQASKPLFSSAVPKIRDTSSLPYVKVSDFGAKGDGSLGDAAAIQTAVTYAAQHSLGLVFDWGAQGLYRTYEIDLMDSNVPLFIDGGNVTLEPYDGNSRFALLNIQTSASSRPNGFSVVNLNLNAQNTQYGIYINASQYVALSRIQVTGASVDGIYVLGTPGLGVWNLFMGDILALGNGVAGVVLQSQDPSGQPRVGLVQMVNVASDGNGSYYVDQNGNPAASGGIGILIDGAGVDADGCSAEKNAAVGLTVVNGGYGNFRGAYFEQNGTGTRWVNGGDNCVFSDTTLCQKLSDHSYNVNTSQAFELDARSVGAGVPASSSVSFVYNPSAPSAFNKFSWVDALIYPTVGGMALNVDQYRQPSDPDDTNAINAALYYAAVQHKGLQFTPGKTYYTSQGIRVANGNVPLFINGNGATIQTTSATDGIYIENPQNTVSRFLVRDLKVECNYTGINGLHVHGAQYIVLRNIDVGHCNNLGFFVEGSIGMGVYYSTFENISAHGNVYTGIYMATDDSVSNVNYGTDKAGTYVAANAMLGLSSNWNGSYGYKFVYASERCDNCAATHNDGSGIDGEDSLYLYFAGSTLTDNSQGAFWMAPIQWVTNSTFVGVADWAVN